MRCCGAAPFFLFQSRRESSAIKKSCIMGKSSKSNKKKDQQQQQKKKEASWEEQQPLKDFFQIKEVGGGLDSGNNSVVRHPIVHAPAGVRRGTGGMCHMNYKTFEKDHLEHAQEQQEEPVAFLIHGSAV